MLYFIDSSHPTKTLLRERGFPHDLCELASLPGAQLLAGPDGKSGSLFHLRDEGLATPTPWKPLNYNADKQRWFNRGGGMWFGWDEQPTPKTLRRKTTLSGHNIKLRDGNEWEVPAIRIITGDTGLPRVFGLDKDGQVTRVVPSDYAALQEFTQRAWIMVSGESQDSPSDEESFGFVCAALRLNYRIESREVAAMELIGDRTELVPCVQAMCDLPTLDAFMRQMEADQKKTASDVAPG